jgi:hypothetical protein
MSSHINKALIASVIFALFCAQSNAQIIAYFNFGAFNIPSKQAFVETYLTIVGNSLSYKKTNDQYNNSVSILTTISKDSTIIKANKYNLTGPSFNDTLKIPSFIDNQRYPLENGTYTIQISISDNYNKKQKPLQFIQKFMIAYNNKDLQASSIQILESYKKTTVPGPITKSGIDLIPYNVNYFPETQTELPFYFEAYNTDTVLGKNKAFIFYYYIETSNDFNKLNSFGSFKKQATAKVNPLLGKIDISKLGSGNYNLVVEIKDEKNILQHQSKFFFQRLNKTVDIIALNEYSEKKSVNEYFGACNNADTLKMFVECLWPIANGIDKDRVINQAVKKDPELMKNSETFGYPTNPTSAINFNSNRIDF